MTSPSRLGWPAVTSAARTAIAATAAFLIARLSGLPEAYWAAILTLVIMQSTLGATLRISGERFIGTLLGAIAGGLLARYFPQVWWVFFVFALGVFLLGILCALFRLQNSYRFAGITLAIVMLIPHSAAPWIVALHRFIEVSIGIVVGLAVTAVWPDPADQAA
ncbi:MAG: FUSC family protein [Terriglobales bacterium]